MKKIKLFPAPNLEVRVYVTDEMEEDLKECKCLARVPDGPGKDCETCSWNGVEFSGIGMCELPEVWRQVLEKEEEKVIPPAPASWRYHMERRFTRKE